MLRFHSLVALVCSLAVSLAAASVTSAQSAFVVGGVSAAPGTVQAGSLTVPPQGGDQGTTIPFSIIHGTKPGPVLALIAGTHGMEYAPIVALQQLRTTID